MRPFCPALNGSPSRAVTPTAGRCRSECSELKQTLPRLRSILCRICWRQMFAERAGAFLPRQWFARTSTEAVGKGGGSSPPRTSPPPLYLCCSLFSGPGGSAADRPLRGAAAPGAASRPRRQRPRGGARPGPVPLHLEPLRREEEVELGRSGSCSGRSRPPGERRGEPGQRRPRQERW